MVCILWHIVVKYKLKLYRNFEHKGDKATMQILNLKTKTIKSKHSIHIISLPQTISADFVLLLYYAQFPQTLSFCYIMPTYISIFLFPSKVSVLVHFQESLFVSNANFQRFGLTFSCQMAQTRSQNKTTFTATRSQGCMYADELPSVNATRLFWRVVTGTLR